MTRTFPPRSAACGSLTRHSSALVLFLIGLCGCAVGPDFRAPGAPPVSGYTREIIPVQTVSTPIRGGDSQRFINGGEIPGQWWQLFHSPALDRLVAEALRNNADFEAAQAALRSSRELYEAQNGILFPAANAGFTSSRQRNASGTLAPVLNSSQPVYNLYTAQLNVGYVVDVFGGSRRAVESAGAQFDAQRFQMLATYLTLTSNVVCAAIQEASLRAQIQASSEIITIEEKELRILERQAELGQIGPGDVFAQEAALAQARAALFPLERQLAQQRTLLTALAGRYASNETEETFDLAGLTLPVEIPVSLPSQLVEQRPDVKMAEAELHYATAQVGVAIANMLPQISLSGQAGGVSTQLSQLFIPGSRFWSIGSDIAQPIFEGGALHHRERAAEASLDEARAQYRSVVITAFENVADSLHALELDARALAVAASAQTAAERSLTAARRQVELGATSNLALLNAELGLQQARINLVATEAGRYSDTAALFQALGGGWAGSDSPIAQIKPETPSPGAKK